MKNTKQINLRETINKSQSFTWEKIRFRRNIINVIKYIIENNSIK